MIVKYFSLRFEQPPIAGLHGQELVCGTVYPELAYLLAMEWRFMP
jgi:hypothetical protein